MFTGVIEEIGEVRAIRESGGKRYVTIACRAVLNGLKPGDSIACNGPCLTAVEFTTDSVTVEVMAETLRKTVAGRWTRGARLNLERAMPAGGRLNGHIVQGHVDRTSAVTGVRREGETVYIGVQLPRQDAALVVAQGSVALDGVSLTVAWLHSDSFEVALIGTTLAHTTLSSLRAGDSVNVEYDVLGKYVLRHLETGQKRLSEDFLREHGF